MRNLEEIAHAICEIEKRLSDKRINRYVNAPIKEGYLKSVEILKAGQTEIEKAGIEELKTTQGRAIVVLTIDFLNEEVEEKVLLNVPIKGL